MCNDRCVLETTVGFLILGGGERESVRFVNLSD